MAVSVNGKQINLNRYPDGTYPLRLDDIGDIGREVEICWKYSGEHELPVVIYLAKHLREIGCSSMKLYMPYIPNARLDRVKNDCEVFTLKYFCQVINSLGFDSVDVLDPHSHVSSALIDRVRVIQPTSYIDSAVAAVSGIERSAPLMFYPDEGAMKRYSELVAVPYAFGIKKRDWKTAKITAFEIHGENPIGKNVLMVDDICSRGGTFYHSAMALKKAGANNIYIYVTHCEDTIFSGELLKGNLIEHIYTTDSIFASAHDKITTFSI